MHAADRPAVPVAMGEAAPIGPAPDMRPADFIHGADGLGNTNRPPSSLTPVDEPASEFLARLVGGRPGEVAVVTLGPLSTLGRVVEEHPTFAAAVADLVVMGGSARRGGNALPNGEANVAHDPVAAARVVTADWRTPPLLVGLDVTHEALLTEADFELLAEHRSPAAAFLDEPLRFYRQFGSTFTAPAGTPCHDLLATMALVDPGLFPEAPVLPVAVDCSGGPAWGATVVDFRAPAFARLEGSAQALPPDFANWRIALTVDSLAFRRAARALFGDD
jgi:purine nucleosidase